MGSRNFQLLLVGQLTIAALRDARVLNALEAQLRNNGLQRLPFALLTSCNEVYERWVDKMVPHHQYALLHPAPLRSNSTAMRMFIPEPSDEPIEADQLASALHHRRLLHDQSTQIQGDQSSLFDPNQVTELTLRIIAPRPDIFEDIANNCPNLQILTVYDGVDFQPDDLLEVPCRFAPKWKTGLARLRAIEKFTYAWTLDSPHDGAMEAPGRTRLATRWDEDAERYAVSILVAVSPSIQEIAFAVFRPFIANQSDSGRTVRKVIWRKQSSTDWTAEVQNEIES